MRWFGIPLLAAVVGACDAGSVTSGNLPDGGRDASAMDAAATDGPAGDSGGQSDAGTVPPAACTLPFGLVDVSHPTTVVGMGSHVCNQAALAAAVQKGGI